MSDHDSEQKDHDIAVSRKAVEELMKHFDYVQIFAGRSDASIHTGRGDFHARFGQCALWVAAVQNDQTTLDDDDLDEPESTEEL